MRRALLAAALLTAVPFAGAASARCHPDFAVVCSTYTTACRAARDADPTGKVVVCAYP